MRVLYIPAIDRRVSLAAYVAAVKKAKANPNETFSHGLTCWWPCTGEEIMRQFVDGIRDRINQGLSYSHRGKEVGHE